MAVDSGGLIHAAGNTQSSDFPLTADAIQTEPPIANNVGFVTRLTSDAEVQYSTMLGGDGISDIKVDTIGNSYVVGAGGREGFPVTPGAYAPDEVFAEDGVTRLRGTFVSKIDNTGALEHSSWFQPSRGLVAAAGAQITLDGNRPLISGFDSGGPERTSFFIRFDSDISRIVDRIVVMPTPLSTHG